MADAGHVQQYTKTVSIPRLAMSAISQNGDFSKTELRVMFALFSRLNGYNRITECGTVKDENRDPYNYTEVDIGSIAEDLGIGTKKTEKVLKSLVKKGVLENGRNEISGNGYRFTF